MARADQVPLAAYLDNTATILREVSGLNVAPDLLPAQQIAAVSFALSLQPILVRYEAPSVLIDA